jgi:hypothetical protein
VVWGIGNAVLGYLIGASYERWKGYLTPVGLGILVLLAAFILGTRWWGRRREAHREVAHREVAERPEAERPEAGQAVGPDTAGDLKVDGRPADD